MRFCLLILTILTSKTLILSQSNFKDQLNFSVFCPLYFGSDLSSDQIMNWPSVTNDSNRYTVIDVDDFTPPEPANFQYKVPFGFGIGWQSSPAKGQPIMRHAVDIYYMQIINKQNDGRRLRYTDMVSPKQGFIYGSNYSVQTYPIFFRQLSIQYKLELKLRTRHLQYINISIRTNYVLASYYHLDLFNQKENKYYSFEHQDITFKDKLISMYPDIGYSINIANTKKAQADLFLSFSLGPQVNNHKRAKLSGEPYNRNFLSFVGIRIRLLDKDWLRSSKASV